MKGSSVYLNNILLLLVLLGIGVIMGKQKEGFGNALEDAYNGEFLKQFLKNTDPEEELFNQKLKNDYEKEKNTDDFDQVTNNVKYPTIPCGNENYDGGICRALYKETKILENKSKHCRPGFDCTRVGFFCSKN